MRLLPAAARILLLTFCVGACGSESEEDRPPAWTSSEGPAPFDPGQAYQPLLRAAELSTQIDHPLFLAPVGARWVYEGHTEDGLEHIEVSVLPETREVWGTSVRVIRDTASLDGVLIEDTWDYFAQDAQGNVWYLGEDTRAYEAGVMTSSAGSWEAGLDGALPGIVMLAEPQVGDAYRQEYYAGEAEDFANVVALNQSVSVPAGQFSGCLKTRDLSAIEPDADEYKYYCPGVGNVLEEEEDERLELIEYSGLP
jgi:hypothetical protein